MGYIEEFDNHPPLFYLSIFHSKGLYEGNNTINGKLWGLNFEATILSKGASLQVNTQIFNQSMVDFSWLRSLPWNHLFVSACFANMWINCIQVWFVVDLCRAFNLRRVILVYMFAPS